jgi:hypothetical protein
VSPNHNVVKRILVTGLLVAIAPAIFGQAVSTIQISGVVQDASGALVPGATITANQTTTGFTRSAVSGTDGAYVMAQLPIGPYQLMVEKPGFKTYVQKGIVVQVGENPTINVSLEVGAVGQSVEVTANTQMVETRETSQSTVIDQARITELPLNGRQATQLIVLAGGAVPSRNGNLATSKNYPSSVTLSVSGGQGDGTNYILDGGDHNDAFSNVNQPFPFPDALQEFSVQTSTLSARYGLHPGATVNAVTKSGTNQIHGNVFEFLRNGSLNARNFFAATHDTLKRNQFGGTLGGPIRKDKLFFFGGYQGTRNRQAPPQSLAILPTATALNGDFSTMDSAGCQSTGRAKTLIDPTTGSPFPGNIIPTNRFSAPAVALVTKYLPTSTDPCGNLRYGVPSTGDENQYVGKIDWAQGAKHRVFGRYFITDYSDPAVFTNNALTAARPGVVDRAQSLVLGDTYSLTNSMVNGFHARASRTRVNRGEPSNMINPKTLGIDINPLVPNHIDLTVSGAFTLGCGTCAPAHFMTNSYQVADDVDAVMGHHQFSFGGQIIRNQLNWLAHTLSNGQMTVNGQTTGDSLADLMLGQVSSFQKGGPLATWWRQTAMGLYAHDVWRVAPNFTVNLGIRWEPFLPESDIYAQGTHFDPAGFIAGKRSSVYTNAPPGFSYYGDPNMPKGSTYRHLADFEPRVGLAWHPSKDANTTIRAAYGIFYQNPPILYPERFGQVSPFGNTVALSSPSGGLANPLQQIGGDPFPYPFPPKSDAAFVAFGTYLNMPLQIAPNYVQQWNVSMQRQFASNWLVTATYLGNKSTHLWLQNEQNPAVYVPGASTTANTNQRRILYRLNPAANAGGLISSIALADDGGNSHYNGLTLAVNHRFSRNFSGLANYTWSHCLGSGDFTSDLFTPQYQNPYSRQAEYGNCIFDHRQLFNLSLIVQSPGNYGNPLARRLLSGWEFLLITSRRTGDYLTLASGRDNSFTGIGLDRPDAVGDSHVDNPTLTRYFNTAAFAQNQIGQFGNSGRNSIRGPNQFNIDLGLSRRISFKESRALEIRSEFFNALNHPTFGNPTTTLTNARFGAITSASDPRILQFALKFGF